MESDGYSIGAYQFNYSISEIANGFIATATGRAGYSDREGRRYLPETFYPTKEHAMDAIKVAFLSFVRQ